MNNISLNVCMQSTPRMKGVISVCSLAPTCLIYFMISLLESKAIYKFRINSKFIC